MSEASEIEKLKQENEQLRAQLAKKGTDGALHHKKKERKKVDEKEFKAKSELSQKAISIVVFGASGHLARTKTFPALCALFVHDLMPENVSIVGFARTAMSDSAFHDSISGKLKADDDVKRKFLAATSYVSGDYNKEEDFRKLNQHLLDIEKTKGGPDANRVFYFAIPPSVFKDVAEQIKAAAMSATGWNRIVVEKPFGKDSHSSEELSQQLKQCFTEDQLYRIDHYLGKEMVQNLMVLRFANVVFEPIWNRHYISSVLITFKETQGIEGRGQYFDEYGIIRDVMQNHLMQMLALVAMEPPVTMSAEDVRDEKVKVLRAMRPITKDDIVIGQYIADPEKKEPGYQDDPTVPKGSISPTFATAVIYINNPRWEGIPFILKCGKAIDSKKAEVRVQFKHFPGVFNDYAKTPVNELVMRVQPDEAIYLKLNTKSPGLSESTEQSELNLTYHSRFNVHDLPDAYERLILDVLRGDHRLFVRNDELQFAWDVFTPILHEFENNKQAPLPYKFGSRGPEESDTLMKRVGFKRYEGYNWVAPENHSH